MAATTSLGAQNPPQTVDSFQKMLDLEKRYKLARLQNGQPSQPATSVHPQIKSSPSPSLQTRRQNSREVSSTQTQKSQGDLPLQHMSHTNHVRPVPPLSITIPPTPGNRGKQLSQPQPQTQQREPAQAGGSSMTAGIDQRPSVAEEDDDLTPREKAVTFLAHSDDDEDSLSDRSSICHSPSWEGFNKKKDKKKKGVAKAKDKAEHDTKSKRTSNRLQKAPPLDSINTAPLIQEPRPSTSTSRPSSQAANIHTFSNTPNAINGTANGTAHAHGTANAYHGANGNTNGTTSIKAKKMSAPILLPPVIPETWGVEPSASGLGITDAHSNQTKTAGAAPVASQPSRTTEEGHHRPSSRQMLRDVSPAAPVQQKKPAAAPSSAAPAKSVPAHMLAAAAAAPSHGPAPAAPHVHEKSQYPPTSSRSHTVKNTPSPSPTRRNSIGARIGEMSRFFKPDMRKSSQNPRPPRASSSDRGRENKSYVRQSREQSIDRSMAGLADETMFYNAANISDQESPLETPAESRRPSSSQSRLGLFSRSKHDSKVSMEVHTGHNQPGTPDEQPRMAPKKGPPVSMKNSEIAAKSREPSMDRSAALPKSRSATSMDNETPTGGGLFSTIRSRMSRQSSTASNSPTSATRSFRDRAKDLQTSASTNSLPVVSKTAAANGSQTTIAAPSAMTTQSLQSDLARVPKQARILGEYNSETMAQTAQVSNRPSEGSSTSSYHEDSSLPPSPNSTPDTSRPQSAKGLSTAVESVGEAPPNQPVASRAIHSDHAVSHSSAQGQRQFGLLGGRSSGNKSRDSSVDRPSSKGRHVSESERPTSRMRVLERVDRPESRDRFVDDSKFSPPNTGTTIKRLSTDAPATTESQAQEADALSFVTSRTDQDSKSSMESQASPTGAGDVAAPAEHTQPTIISPEGKTRYEGAGNKSDSSETSQERPRSRSSYRKKDRQGSSSQSKHMSIVTEESKGVDDTPQQSPPLAAQQHQPYPTDPRARAAAGPAPSSSGRSSPSLYLQEARRSVPMLSSPRSNVIRPANANQSTPSLGSAPHRPGLKTSTSFSGSESNKSLLSRPVTALLPGHGRLPVQEAHELGKPMAKMLVECCQCKFFHDMPSRIYECMAQPDAVVTDRDLGVSGAITTMVKCPWCSHNMSTRCCAGYAALVYLKERLH